MLQVQGSWISWVNYVKNDLTWKNALAMPPKLLSFCLAATFDVLPSPSNLRRWHISTESSCTLCQKPICTTAHVLSACKVALTQGRFTFRHDKVLASIVEVIGSFISKLPCAIPSSANKVTFVKEGTKIKSAKPSLSGLLYKATDWSIKSDLSGNLLFPLSIAATSLRPDIPFQKDRKLSF